MESDEAAPSSGVCGVSWVLRDSRGYLCGLVVLGAGADFFYINVIFPATEYQSTGRVPYALYFQSLAWSDPLSILKQLAPPTIAKLLAGALAIPLVVVAAVPLCAVVAIRPLVRRT